MSNLFVSAWLACVKFLFTSLHIICNGLHYFDSTWTLFKRKWEAAVTLNGVDAELYVSRFVTGLQCPTHLAVIVADDAAVLEDFAKLIVWCLAAGISFLTIYDQKGRVLEQEAKLCKYFSTNYKIAPKKVIFRNLQTENGRGANGFTHKLHVNALSGSDGKAAFLSMAQDLLNTKLLGLNTQDKIATRDAMAELIVKKRGYPDPELAIVASPYMCAYGYPPWDIRLTEFVRTNTLSGMNVREFCQILHQYTRCQKRHGK